MPGRNGDGMLPPYPNPIPETMTALASYLRHLIVVMLLYVVQKYQLPVDGADAAANAVALAAFGSLTWAVVKYAPDFAKNLGLIAVCLMALQSCATTTTVTKLPDGTLITVTAKASDAAAINGAVAVTTAILPLMIHHDK